MVEPGEQIAAETRNERRAWQVDDVADTFQSDAAQRRDGLGFESQRGERQRRDRGALTAGWDDGSVGSLHLTEARRRPGGADGRCDGGMRR